MAETVTVTQLNNRVKEMLRSSHGFSDIWVIGEISNLKHYPSGYYFTLKDAGAAVRAVMFNSAIARIDFRPADSMKVMVYGRADMYVKNGTYQLVAELMRLSGVGDLYIEYEKLKRKLEAEGLFDRSRKRPIPPYPRRVGVVTSPSGAVIHDIITTSSTRFPADIVLAPSSVQGEGAANEIAAGIRLLNKARVDVIIVGRGGGSIEDLWPFNEETVARAIAASEVPIVSAVGHETDFTIADFVADARAPTPTGAATLVLKDRDETRSRLDALSSKASAVLRAAVDRMDGRFRVLDARLSPRRAADSLEMSSMHLDRVSMSLRDALSDAVGRMRSRFELADSRISPEKASERMQAMADLADSMAGSAGSGAEHAVRSSSASLESVGRRPERAVSNILSMRFKDLDSMSGRMEGLNPANVLGRGYAMVVSADGRIRGSAASLSVGDEVVIRMRDGSAGARISSKEMKG